MGLSDVFRSFLGFPRRDDDLRFNQPPLWEEPSSGVNDNLPRQPPTFFFGFPGLHHPPGGRDDDDDGDDDDDDSPGGRGQDPFFRFGFHFSSSDEGDEVGRKDSAGIGVHIPDSDHMFRHFDEMFRSFDEVFRSMGMAEGFSGIGPRHGFPSLEPPPGGSSKDSQQGSLRDKMLKDPDTSSVPNGHGRQTPNGHGGQSPNVFGKLYTTPNWDHSTWEKMDKDLDEQARKGNLKDLFDKSYEPPAGSPYPHNDKNTPRAGPFKSVSVRTYRSADGKIEERRTVKDGQGNEETVVLRHIDGQTHTITTRRDKDTEPKMVNEYFRNMDKAEVPDFDRRWHCPTPNFDRDRPKDDLILPDEETTTVFRKLFPGFPGFGSFGGR